MMNDQPNERMRVFNAGSDLAKHIDEVCMQAMYDGYPVELVCFPDAIVIRRWKSHILIERIELN